MTSEVEICNVALSNIRAGSINSLDESSLAAQQCKLKYPLFRDMLLKHNWGFNRKIESLGLTTHELFNWAYAYQYPNDCLKLNRLVGEHEELQNADADVISRLVDAQILPINDLRRRIPHELFNVDGDKVIGANEANLRIDYAAKVTDPNLFNVDFVLALSHLLAAEIAIPIVGAETGRQLRSDEMELYTAYVDSAIADDMNEDYEDPKLSEFETIRR